MISFFFLKVKVSFFVIRVWLRTPSLSHYALNSSLVYTAITFCALKVVSLRRYYFSFIYTNITQATDKLPNTIVSSL